MDRRPEEDARGRVVVVQVRDEDRVSNHRHGA